jgi:hypothetical protein
MNPALDQFWNFVYFVDDTIYGITGYHLFKYSPAVIKTCFSCDLAPFPEFPTAVFEGDFQDLENVFSNVGHDLEDGAKVMVDAFDFLIRSVTGSTNIVFQDFGGAYDDVQNGIKDSINTFKEAINAIGGFPDFASTNM